MEQQGHKQINLLFSIHEQRMSRPSIIEKYVKTRLEKALNVLHVGGHEQHLKVSDQRNGMYKTELFFYIKKKVYFIEVQLIYNVVLISTVQQSDSVIHIYIFFFIFFSIMVYHKIEYSSLCYTVGPCCLSILYIIVCIY